MSTLQVFTFPVTAQQVRVAGDTDNPFFCLSDVCSVLDLSNPSQIAASQLKADGLIKNEIIDRMGRTQTVLFVNEANLYRCVMRSSKDQAVAFQDWIVETLLPTIRKTGSFGNVPNVESEASEFWQLVDGAIARNLEPEKAIDLHKRYLSPLAKPEQSEVIDIKTGKAISKEPAIEVLVERLKAIAAKTEGGMITARIARHKTRLIRSSAHACQVFEALEKAGYGVQSNLDKSPRFQFR